ncbi:MAG TPA: hypothetical protein VMU76_11040 [Acidimicrobiales bacterium]|nr:hypothetical protein [Acidimicrobiales bacterium]
MGFLDKVKEQAAVASAAAKDAAQKGQAKLDDLQAKRAADGLLKDLGTVVYAQHSGRGTDTSDGDKAWLIAALESHEAAHGSLALNLESPATGDGAAADG